MMYAMDCWPGPQAYAPAGARVAAAMTGPPLLPTPVRGDVVAARPLASCVSGCQVVVVLVAGRWPQLGGMRL